MRKIALLIMSIMVAAAALADTDVKVDRTDNVTPRLITLTHFSQMYNEVGEDFYDLVEGDLGWIGYLPDLNEGDEGGSDGPYWFIMVQAGAGLVTVYTPNDTLTHIDLELQDSDTIRLELDGFFNKGSAYTARITGVEDLSGNTQPTETQFTATRD